MCLARNIDKEIPMKPLFIVLPMLTAAAVVTGCTSSGPTTIARPAVANFAQCVALGGRVMESDPMLCSVGGEMFVDEALLVTVLQAKPEKDGYSLTVEDMAGKTYQAVISIPNLGPNSKFDFDHIQVGNQLRLKGEVWDLAGVPQITASRAEFVKAAHSSPMSRCPLMEASDLKLWINAMPGPDGPTLIAIFKATAPTPGYSFKGKVTEILESDPPSYVIDVIPIAPSGAVAQVLSPTEVRLDIPIESTNAQDITLTCGGQTLFTVNKVTTAW